MNNIFAVIPTYKPDSESLNNFRNILSQLSNVIVVDDGSGQEYNDFLDKCENIGCIVIRNEENLGIAYATNKGIKFARQNNAEAILTLDQDTDLPAGYVEKIVTTYRKAQIANVPFAFISPAYTQKHKYPVLEEKNGFAYISETMQSGMLIPVETFDKIGLLDEGLFIDCVDTEYYLRAKSFNLKNIACPDLDANHDWGKKYYATFCGKEIKFKNASIIFKVNPMFRYYYIYRNRFILHKKYFRSETRWVLHSKKDHLFVAAYMILFYKNKIKFLKMLFWGNMHGILGKTGKIPDKIAKKNY